MKPNTNFDGGGGSILDQVLKGLAERAAQQEPYVPRPVERWNATIVEFPKPGWDRDRRRAVAHQAMELALKAEKECGE